jgi:hypothetical protein
MLHEEKPLQCSRRRACNLYKMAVKAASQSRASIAASNVSKRVPPKDDHLRETPHISSLALR